MPNFNSLSKYFHIFLNIQNIHNVIRFLIDLKLCSIRHIYPYVCVCIDDYVYL